MCLIATRQRQSGSTTSFNNVSHPLFFGNLQRNQQLISFFFFLAKRDKSTCNMQQGPISPNFCERSQIYKRSANTPCPSLIIRKVEEIGTKGFSVLSAPSWRDGCFPSPVRQPWRRSPAAPFASFPRAVSAVAGSLTPDAGSSCWTSRSADLTGSWSVLTKRKR